MRSRVACLRMGWSSLALPTVCQQCRAHSDSGTLLLDRAERGSPTHSGRCAHAPAGSGVWVHHGSQRDRYVRQPG